MLTSAAIDAMQSGTGGNPPSARHAVHQLQALHAFASMLCMLE